MEACLVTGNQPCNVRETDHLSVAKAIHKGTALTAKFPTDKNCHSCDIRRTHQDWKKAYKRLEALPRTVAARDWEASPPESA